MSYVVFDAVNRSFVGGPSEFASVDVANQWIGDALGLAARRSGPMPEFVVIAVPDRGASLDVGDEALALAEATLAGSVNDWVEQAQSLAHALLEIARTQQKGLNDG